MGNEERGIKKAHQDTIFDTKKHQLIQNYNDRVELYDLENDPDEVHNLVDDHPALVRTLGQRLDQRFKEGSSYGNDTL